ncbi:MAG: hypothetical protein O2931_13775 [Planctomycetota bacterium]|nr:hypothetical protein [Planctomycetota bacterium]MDA1179854.1 hypothetical protein [Planctomycetota bacterium]
MHGRWFACNAWLAVVLLNAVVADVAAFSRHAFESADDPGNVLSMAADPERAKVANLKDQLEKGLKARRPEEFAYIGYIHSLVESGDLPVKLVLETFHWSRRQDPHFPFPYFQRAIRVRAARAGITIQ